MNPIILCTATAMNIFSMPAGNTVVGTTALGEQVQLQDGSLFRRLGLYSKSARQRPGPPFPRLGAVCKPGVQPMTRAALVAIFASGPLLAGTSRACGTRERPAAEAPEDAMIDDRGGTLCSQYLQVRQYDPNLDKNFWNFALGLISGLNMGRLIAGQDVRGAGSRIRQSMKPLGSVH